MFGENPLSHRLPTLGGGGLQKNVFPGLCHQESIREGKMSITIITILFRRSHPPPDSGPRGGGAGGLCAVTRVKRSVTVFNSEISDFRDGGGERCSLLMI